MVDILPLKKKNYGLRTYKKWVKKIYDNIKNIIYI